MTPVFQSRGGPDGDCFEACLATLLGVPLAEVPDLAAGWPGSLRSWLAARSLAVAFRQGGPPPPGPSIAARLAVDGSIHCVACEGGAIAHDPSPRPLVDDSSPTLLWTILKEIS